MSLIFDGRSCMNEKPTGVGVYGRELLSQVAEGPLAKNLVLFTNDTRPARNVSVTCHVHTQIPNKFLNAAIALRKKPTIESLITRRTQLIGANTVLAPNINFLAVDSTTRLALTVHDLSFHHFPFWYSPKMRLWHRLTRPAELIQRADIIFAVSATTAQDCIETFGVNPDRVHVVYPGLRPTREMPRIAQLPDRYILCVSSIEPRKNIETLLAAFARLRENPAHHDVHLVIAGPLGFNGHRILKKIDELSLAPFVHYLGFVPDHIRASLLSHAACFVYPSYFEGFGFPPLEAMQYGVPVVASHGGSLSEVVGSAALLADPYRPSEFTIALDAFLSDSALAARFSALGRTHAGQFTWAQATQKIERLLCT